MCISANPFFWARLMMEQLKKPSIISGNTVMISMRIFYQFSAKVQNNGLFSAKFAIFVPEQTLYYMNEVERIYQLRDELHRHNYNYYVLNAPEIGDQEFDFLMRELQDLEAKHPECMDEHSPTMRVGSDLNKNFTQVTHKYPMLSLANTYSEAEVADFYNRVKKDLNEDFEVCCEMKFDGTSISLTYGKGNWYAP